MATAPSATSIVCIAGSLFLVGEVLAQLAGAGDSPCRIENGTDSM
jgi:hypothetical protein